MVEWWQNLPASLDPIAFTVGFVSIRFYALFFLIGFAAAFGFFLWWTKKDEKTVGDPYDLFLAVFLGAFFGGRLGFLVLYRPDIFVTDPLGIFLPYDFAAGTWTGISGMSFHGGLVGVVLALWWHIRKRSLDFFSVTDRIVLAVPIALFFGRIGNFLNKELPGRPTDVSWGMYFPEASFPLVLRHPSTLYEALGEGLFLFTLLFFVARMMPRVGVVSATFLVGYGVIRFVLEYFREPDYGVSFVLEILTRGQAFSLVMIAVGVVLFLWIRKENYDTLKR